MHLVADQVCGFDGPYVNYKTSTQAGSSGSPVLNDQWQLIALHRGTVRKRRLDRDLVILGPRRWNEKWDRPWNLDVDANQGIRISEIVYDLHNEHSTKIAGAVE